MTMLGLEETEVLAQLAEEAAELAQAALKLRRALDGRNPTPVSEAAARAALIEESTDVALCLNLLQIEADWALYRKKYSRWRQRLLERDARERERRTAWKTEPEA